MDQRILIVEDDPDINRLLAKVLGEAGYRATSAYSGSEAQLVLRHECFDCLLLDLMLPGVDGEALIADIRIRHTVPIIVISARPGIAARVQVLRLGADDFIPKPFDNEEVLARVEAQLRRSQVFSPSTRTPVERIRYKHCELNLESMTVAVNGEPIDFTALEYQIFALLMQNPERVFTRSNLFNACWKQEYLGDDNTVDVHISHIRAKIAQFDDQEYIKTVRGIGYRLSK